jgi:rubrerythrin
VITGKEELLQVMIEAFIMEKGTNEFYDEASRKALDGEARKAFRQLAEWEKEHMQYIQFLYQSIRDERETMSFEDFEKKVSPETVEGAIPRKYLEEKFHERYSFIDDLGALTAALEIEGKAYNFYRKLSETAEEGNVKAFMRDMMEWEKKHIEYLKSLRFRIAETS